MLREFARNNIPVLRRIFVRIQSATMGAYCNIRALSQSPEGFFLSF